MSTRRALLSVSDKRGLVPFAKALSEAGFELVSTGGTAKTIAAAGLAVRKVADITGFPELLEGRVKTLHPRIHAGILARLDRPEDLEALREHDITAIEVVAVNLYPFARAVAGGATLEVAQENIDIGGPAMLRAAAKNARHVLPLCDPDDYQRVGAALAAGEVPLALRLELAAKAFAHTAQYDATIAAWMSREGAAAAAGTPANSSELPAILGAVATRARSLRYGENPHQTAAFYRWEGASSEGDGGLADAAVLQGKELSFNNLLDLDAAWALCCELEGPAAVVVKHTNPCGVAQAPTLEAAYRIAREADAQSAFGGIVALTREVDEATARALAETFLEAVVAPGYSEAARTVLAAKTNLRVVAMPSAAPRGGLDVRSIRGGLLVQSADRPVAADGAWKVVTRRAPTAAEESALAFGWRVVKHVKSNAIVFTTDTRTLGVGAGQMSRVDSVQVARSKAANLGANLQGSVLASDAFFPFPDGVLAAADAGATAIVQPGGSVRDAEVIAAADERGLAMVFTGARHFRH